MPQHLRSGRRGAGHSPARSLSRVMVHQPRGGMGGTAADIEIEAREILSLRARLNGLYCTHSGRPLSEIEAAVDRDTYLGPHEAVKFGLIDEVISQRPPSLIVDLAPKGKHKA